MRMNSRMFATARLLENYAAVVQAALDHLDAEEHALDWHPSTTGGGGGGSGNVSRPAERSALALVAIQTQRAQLLDDIGTIVSVIGSAMVVANKALGIRAPEPAKPFLDLDVTPRCSQRIDPLCENFASPHRDGEGIVHGELCDACWQKACPGCHRHPVTSRRQITIDGRRVDGCDSCQRREQRHLGRVASVAMDDEQG